MFVRLFTPERMHCLEKIVQEEIENLLAPLQNRCEWDAGTELSRLFWAVLVPTRFLSSYPTDRVPFRGSGSK